MGTVIKAGQVARIQHRFKGLDVNDHIAEAKTRLANARRESAAIVEAAQTEAAAIRQQAHKQGYAEGLAEGTRTGQKTGHDEAYGDAVARYDAQIKQLIEVMTRTVANVDKSKDDLLLVAQNELLRFAFDVAKSVTKQVAVDSDSAAIDNARQALAIVGRNTDVTVRMHPADADAMKRFASEASNSLTNATHLRLVEDDGVAKGGCIVETPCGVIDATIDGQLAQAEQVLFGATDGSTAG